MLLAFSHQSLTLIYSVLLAFCRITAYALYGRVHKIGKSPLEKAKFLKTIHAVKINITADITHAVVISTERVIITDLKRFFLLTAPDEIRLRYL